MNRGVNHQRIFFGDSDRVEFGRRLAEIHERFGVVTLAYCLVENHYHLLLQTPDGGLSQAMHHLGLVFARRTNDRVRRDGPLFRGRFRSIPVTTDGYLMCAARYIHRNALDVRGVRSIDRYRWSSYRAYLGVRPPPPFLDTSIVLGCFRDDVDALARFTENATVAFTPATPDDVVQLVRWAMLRDDLRRQDGEAAPVWQERTALMLLVEWLEAVQPQLGAALDDLLGHSSPDARRMAKRRARERAGHPTIESVVADVITAIQPQRRAA